MQNSGNCTKEQNALLHFETTLKNPNLTPVMIIFLSDSVDKHLRAQYQNSLLRQCKLSYRDISNEALITMRVCVNNTILI